MAFRTTFFAEGPVKQEKYCTSEIFIDKIHVDLKPLLNLNFVQLQTTQVTCKRFPPF